MAKKNAPKLMCSTSEQARQLRQKKSLNQSIFWAKISITQSGGSRYESGRSIPKTVQHLLHLAYGTDKQAAELLTWLRREAE